MAQGGLSLDDAFTQVVELPAVPPGAYLAHWIAITADDNGKTQGDVNFTVVAATPSPAATPTPATSPTYAPPSSASPAGASPSATPAATATQPPSPSPSPAPGDSGQASGSELIIPIVLVGAAVVGLAWFLVRRRPSLIGPLDHLPTPGAILFDLDGTLVDTVGARIEGWLKTFAEIGIDADRGHVARLIGADGKRLAIEVAGVAGREFSAGAR